MGLKKPNAWGLYDMLGNVWEWVQDRGDCSNCLVYDPLGRADEFRLLLGGGWNSSPGGRGSGTPDRAGRDYGFRLALSPKY